MRVLVIDLNNFARYPTLPVGLLVAILRDAGQDVDVLSPLARGVKGYPRMTRARPWGLIDDRLRYWSAVTPSVMVRKARAMAARLWHPGGSGDRSVILAYALEKLGMRPDIVLISAYTMYEDTCSAIAEACEARGIPVVIGGNYFTAPEIVERWSRIRGVSAVFGGEPEPELLRMVEAIVTGARPLAFTGLTSPRQPPAAPAQPVTDIDRLPFPDYSDFPWEKYPNRIVPLLTGRGCGWGRCRFCSDIVTSAGRTFRSRSLDNVLAEIAHQSHRHDASLFAFLDLKLNSNVPLWRGLLERLPAVAPRAAWTASVHVDSANDHGLFRDDLRQAARAGLTRVTTGLESASERLLKSMAKGTRVERTSEFVRHAAEAGISVRLTAISGYPGEEPDDVDRTTRFLDDHARWIERVTLHRFSLMLGTELDRDSLARGQRLHGLRRGTVDPSTCVIQHENPSLGARAHRRSTYRLMEAVHRINRRELGRRAREFEGVM